jgi:cytochrome c556
MHLSFRTSGFVAAAVVSGFTLLPMGSSLAASAEEVIKARINFMEDEVGGQWRLLAAFAKSGKGSLADVEKSARALSDLAKKIPAHFPKDTGRGNYPDNVTRALPAIWKDSERFQKDIQRLADESEKLARLAKEGNKDAVVAMIGPTGSYPRTKIGCAECHESFRGARAKE